MTYTAKLTREDCGIEQISMEEEVGLRLQEYAAELARLRARYREVKETVDWYAKESDKLRASHERLLEACRATTTKYHETSPWINSSRG